MTRPRTVAIVQARMSSSRLPGKVLLPLGGLPMILFMLRRVQRAQSIDAICLATSSDPSDDRLAATVQGAGYAVHRGSLDDVLERYAGAAAAMRAETVVRLTGDCPLIDPAQIDRVVDTLHARGLDYANNSEQPTYPDGLDVEAMRADALMAAMAEARLPSEREHVTPFIRHRGERFRLACLQGPVDLSALRWTVDHDDDYQVVRALVDGVANPVAADLFDYLRVMDSHPALRDANRHGRNEGYAKSLADDARLAATA